MDYFRFLYYLLHSLVRSVNGTRLMLTCYVKHCKTQIHPGTEVSYAHCRTPARLSVYEIHVLNSLNLKLKPRAKMEDRQ